MLIHFFWLLMEPYIEFNLYTWALSISGNLYNFLAMSIFIIFIFCLINVLVLVVAGIYFIIFSKKYKLGTLCLLSVSCFLYYASEVVKQI